MSRSALLLAVLAAMQVSCDMWDQYDHTRWRPPAAMTRPTAGRGPATRPAVKDRLTLRDALVFAWYGHPEMRRAQALIGAAHGVEIQAGLWPNPDLAADYLEEPDRKAAATVGVSQKFELGGKRQARVSAAAAEVFLAESQLRETWTDIRAAVKAACVRLAYTRQRNDILTRIAETDTERVQLADSLLQAGKLPENELLEAKLRHGRSLAAVKANAALLADARRQVKSAVGIAPDAATPTFVCSIDVDGAPAAGFEELLALAERNSTALATARARTAVARARLNLARTQRWSDVSVGMGYRRSDYRLERPGVDHALLVGLKVDLPVWDRNQGNIAAGRDRITAARHGRQTAALTVAAQLSQLLAARRGWIDQETVLRDRVLPAAKRQLELAADAFGNGKTSKLKLLQRRREVDAIELEILQGRLMRVIAAIQLEKIAAAATEPGPS